MTGTVLALTKEVLDVVSPFVYVVQLALLSIASPKVPRVFKEHPSHVVRLLQAVSPFGILLSSIESSL